MRLPAGPAPFGKRMISGTCTLGSWTCDVVADPAVLAEGLAMVGGEHEDGAIPEAQGAPASERSAPSSWST